MPPRQPGAAIITLSRAATQTGRRLLERLPQSVLYAPQRFVDGETAENIIPYRVSIRQVLQAAFQTHTALVCLMASGIAIRELAPLLRSKQHDPAVIVVDAAGTYAISLLGGHQGGANKLAQEVAAALGGTAVLTTASDVQHLPAIDLLGTQYGWTLEDNSKMTAVCAALVNGDPVGVYQDAGDRHWFDPPHVENLIVYPSLEALQAARPAGAILITYRTVPQVVSGAIPSLVVYHPRCLVVGVGCNRGTPQAEIIEAVEQTLDRAGLSPGSVHEIVSIDAKADEPGLLAACAERGWPLRLFSRADLAGVPYVPNPSVWAQKQFDVPGVAEPAALLGADTDTLLVEKCRYPNVTVAIAQRKEQPS